MVLERDRILLACLLHTHSTRVSIFAASPLLTCHLDFSLHNRLLIAFKRENVASHMPPASPQLQLPAGLKKSSSTSVTVHHHRSFPIET